MPEMDTKDSAPINKHNHNAALDQTLDLLKAHDDTSRFVGLALLKSLLDNHENLRNDPGILSKCWAAVPIRFLERLLKAPKSKQKSAEETTNMVELAVAVVYSFTLLMPTIALEDDKLIEMTAELVPALRYSSSETQIQILRILLGFAGGLKGARALLRTEDLSPLFEIAPSQTLTLEVLRYALLNATVHPELEDLLGSKPDDIISGLISCFKDIDAKQLLEFLTDLLPKLPLSDVRPQPPWLHALANLMRANISSRPSTSQKTVILLSSALLQDFPSTFPRLLFENIPVSKGSEKKPFLYFFVNLTSIDLRSTFPSLVESLASPEYPDISQRLAADFNILCAFISFLADLFDDEEDQSPLPLPPDLLLKLRRDLGETASLTIEFLRDRWDGAVAGAAGIHPSIRPGPDTPAPKDTPLSLTWDDKNGGITKDPLTLSAIQYLALWIREDNGETLRKEAAGIIDVLLGLYDDHYNEPESQNHGRLDFRSPVLVALQSIVAIDDGAASFLREDGWPLLSKGLSTRIHEIFATNAGVAAAELMRAMQVIDVLYTVQDHESEKGAKEEWMALVKMAASLPTISEHDHVTQLDFRVALYRLATALLTWAPVGMRSRFSAEAAAIAGSCKELVGMHETLLNVDSVETAREVLGSLDRLDKTGLK